MFPKAGWFRAQNSVNRRVVASLPSINLLVAHDDNVELDRYPKLMDAGGRSALMPDPVCTISVSSRCAWRKGFVGEEPTKPEVVHLGSIEHSPALNDVKVERK